MGTTADKLNKILQTKEAIRQSIIGKGVDVTPSDTFASYPAKIDSIKASGGSAEYEFMDTQSLVTYPKKTMSADEWKNSPMWFSVYGDSLHNLDAFKSTNEGFAFYLNNVNRQGLAKVFDNDYDTWEKIQENDIILRFKEPVLIESIEMAYSPYGTGSFEIFGTNDSNTILDQNFMEKIVSIQGIKGNSPTVLRKFEAKTDTPYKYLSLYSHRIDSIYEFRITVITGSKKLTLKSPNMTPLIDYNVKPAKVITQPFYDGEKIIESKALQFKPYDEGGALLDYVDDLEPVDLGLLLCKGTKDFPIFGNYDILGSINVENGIASGFSESNGLLIRETVPQVNTLKMIIKGNSSNINHNNVLYCNYQGSEKYIAIHSNNKFAYYTGSWTDGTTTLRPSTEYWFAVEKKDTTFVGYLLEDKNYTLDRLPPFEQWSREWESTEDIFSGMRLSIGLNTSTVSEYFSGAIDLNGCKIDINGSTWWTPVSSYENRPVTEYFLAKDENVSLPAGFTDRLKVSTLSLPERRKIIVLPPALEPME